MLTMRERVARAKWTPPWEQDPPARCDYCLIPLREPYGICRDCAELASKTPVDESERP